MPNIKGETECSCWHKLYLMKQSNRQDMWLTLTLNLEKQVL